MTGVMVQQSSPLNLPVVSECGVLWLFLLPSRLSLPVVFVFCGMFISPDVLAVSIVRPGSWEEKALFGEFLNSLNEQIKCELATKELPKTLDALIYICVRLDDLMHEYGKRTRDPQWADRESSSWTGFQFAEWHMVEHEQPDDAEQPMHVGYAKLTLSDWRRRHVAGFACGEKGDFTDASPSQLKDAACH